MALKLNTFLTGILGVLSFQLQSQSAILHDQCENAKPVTAGIQISDRIGFVALDYIQCPSIQSPVAGIWYQYEGKNNIAKIELLEAHDATLFFQIFEGSCDSLVCLPSGDLRFFAEENKTYFIMVAKLPYVYGQKITSFQITESDQPDYDVCSRAWVMECDSTYEMYPGLLTPDYFAGACSPDISAGWVKITGDGTIKTVTLTAGFFNEIQYQIFENDCDSLKCIYQGEGTQFRVATVPGKDFYMAVTHENLNLAIPISVRLTCRNEEGNNTCYQATELSCDQNITGILQDTMPIDLIIAQSGEYPGLWYVLSGDNVRHRIRLSSATIENLVIEMFKDTDNNCANGLSPVQFNPYPLNEDEYVINTLPGEVTYIKVSYFRDPVPFNLALSCSPIENNLTCDLAKSITCDSIMHIYETAAGNFSVPKTGDEGNWFSFVGNNRPYLLTSNASKGPVHFDVFTGDCDSLIPVKSFEYFFTAGNALEMSLPEGNEYFIRTSFFNFNFSFIELSVQCSESTTNVFCHNAQTTACGRLYNIVAEGDGVSCEEDPCNTGMGYWYSVEGNDSIVEVLAVFPFQQFSVYEGSCGQLHCLYANQTFTGYRPFRFLAEAGSSYFIKFFNIPPQSQRSFQLNCYEPEINLSCASADTLTCTDTLITMDFSRIPSNEITGDCRSHEGQWYVTEGNDKLFSISAHQDVDIHVYEGLCEELQCLYVANGRYNFIAETGKKYFIQFESRFSDVHNVRFQCTDYTEGSCQNPLPVACDSESILSPFLGTTLSYDGLGTPGKTGFWRAFEGNGQTIGIKTNSTLPSGVTDVYLIDNNCQSSRFLAALAGLDSFYFPTDSGVLYTLLFSTPNSSDVALSMTCEENEGHHTCDDALDIQCSVPFDYTSAFRTHDSEKNLYNQSWYKIAGNDQLMYITLNHPAAGLGYVIIIYESAGDCDDLTEIGRQTGNGRTFTWRSNSDKNYFVQIGLTNKEQTAMDWTWVLHCTPDQSAQECAGAPNLECGIEYTISTLDLPATTFSNCAEAAPGAWFTLEGDNQLYQLEITDFYHYFGDIHLYIGEGDCEQFICLEASTLNRQNPVSSFTARAGKNYVIKWEGEPGNPLSLVDFLTTCKNLADNDSCYSAKEIICGETYSGQFGNLPIDTDNACRDEVGGLYFVLNGEGKEVQLVFEPNADLNIQVSVYEQSCDTTGNCLHQADLNEYRNAIAWKAEENVNYAFRISSFDSKNSPFTFTMSCIDSPKNNECVDAPLLYCLDTVRFSMLNPLGYTGITPCHFTTDARVFWYQLPRTGKVLEVDILQGKNTSYYISLMTGVCDNLICEQFFDINNDKIFIETPEDFNYYIAIHGDALSDNAFEFVLKCLDELTNDECENAQLVQCGDTVSANVLLANYSPYIQDGCQINAWKDVWYEIEGTGDIIELTFVSEANFGGFVNVFLKGDCFGLTCLENGTWRNNTRESVYRFKTNPNESYLFSVQHPIGDTTIFAVRCVPSADNDVCQGAYAWLFGDTTLIDISGSVGDLNLPCYQGQRTGVWYSFTGDGGYVNFSSEDTDSSPVSYTLLEGSCESLTCLFQGQFNPNETLEFRTDKDRKYFLVMYGNGGKIISSGGDLSDNFECASALTLACDVTSVAFSRSLIPDQGNSGCADPDENTAWFAVEGDGNIWDLSFSDSGTDGSLEILTACGDTCLYRHELETPRPKPFSFLAVEGQRYIVKLNISRADPEQLIIMNTSCRPGHSNYSTDTAVPLECGDFDVNTDNFAINFLQECFASDDVTYWYSFVGSDSLFRLSDTLPDGFTASIVNENCVELHAFEPDTLPFQTEADITYFLVVRHALTDTLPSFVLGVDYGCIIDNTSDVQSGKNILSAVPNPFMDKVRIICLANQGIEANLNLYNSQGRLVCKDSWHLEAGHNEKMMEEWSALPSGLYTLRLFSITSVAEIRLVKL